MSNGQGLLYLLQRSAELLEQDGSDRDERLVMAKLLRKAYKYHNPNFLGGPAKMFDAIADRIRAGESIDEVMGDYGVRYVEKI